MIEVCELYDCLCLMSFGCDGEEKKFTRAKKTGTLGLTKTQDEKHCWLGPHNFIDLECLISLFNSLFYHSIY